MKPSHLLGAIGLAALVFGGGIAAATSTTTTTVGAGQSSAQFTAKHAWVFQAPGNYPASTPLNIPTGQRLAITGDNGAANSFVWGFAGTVNGVNIAFSITDSTTGNFGSQPSQSSPFYLDSGTVGCNGVTNFFGYLTPIP
jgi:hypothetical protein